MMQRIHLSFMPMLAVLTVFFIAFLALMYFFYKHLKEIEEKKEANGALKNCINHHICKCFLYCGALFLIDIVLKLLEECHVLSSPFWALGLLDALLLMLMIAGMFFKAIHNLQNMKDGPETKPNRSATRSTMILATYFFVVGLVDLFSGSSDYMMCFYFVFAPLSVLPVVSKEKSDTRYENRHALRVVFIFALMMISLVIELNIDNGMDLVMYIRIFSIALMPLSYFFCTLYLSNEVEIICEKQKDAEEEEQFAQLRQDLLNNNQFKNSQFMQPFSKRLSQDLESASSLKKIIEGVNVGSF